MILFGSFSGIIACLGDIAVTFYYGRLYSGYSHLSDTLSKLGSDLSPVAKEVSVFWIFLSFFFIVFGAGFFLEYKNINGKIKLASFLIIIYGIGDVMGSGIFPANHLGQEAYISRTFHHIFSNLGMAGIIFFPLILIKTIRKNKSFTVFSIIVFIVGLFCISLYGITEIKIIKDPAFKGLWQRLSILCYYIYVISVAFIMITDVYASGHKPSAKETALK
jgi:hypothetical protein